MGLNWDVSFSIFLGFLFFAVVYPVREERFLQSLGLGTSRRCGVGHLGIRHSDTSSIGRLLMFKGWYHQPEEKKSWLSDTAALTFLP